MSRARIPDEFELIARYLVPLAEDRSGALGLVDDAAVLSVSPGCEIVATTDALVEGVHFRSDDPADLIGRKLLRVNLSDLAAMGARPVAYLLVLSLPEGTSSEWLEGLTRGLAADQKAFGLALVGGDTVATSGPVVLTVTALGEVAAGQALERSGGRAGDRIYVSGTLGDAALGLAALEGRLGRLDEDRRAALANRYRLPEPRLALGRRLVGLAHAVIDVSDGLVADLGHICETSRLGAVIEADKVPLSDAARKALDADPGLLSSVLTGGDDYELAFTVASDDEPRVSALAKELNLPLTAVGRLVEGAGVRVVDDKGADLPLTATGYRHFRTAT